MSQQLPESKIVVSSQDPVACPFQTHPSLFLSREALLSTARKQFLEVPCPSACWYVSCGSQTCGGLDCCDEKGWWSLPAFIFENGSSLNSQSEEKQGLEQKSSMGLAHFSVVLVKIWVWLPRRVYRNSALVMMPFAQRSANWEKKFRAITSN